MVLKNVPGYVIGYFRSSHLFVLRDQSPFQVLSFYRQNEAIYQFHFNINVTSKYVIFGGEQGRPIEIFANDFHELES